MRKHLATFLAVSILALAGAGHAAGPTADRRMANNVFGAIAKEEGEKAITRNRAALLMLTAIKDPSKLPERFRGLGGTGMDGGGGARCGTPVIAMLEGLKKTMTPEELAELKSLMPPEEYAASPKTALALGLAKTVGHDLPNFADTENFSIQWGHSLTNEDGSLPVKDANANGIPDVVEKWGSYLEQSFKIITQDLGYTQGLLGTYKIKVYIGNSDPSVLVGNGTYGLTYPGSPPYIVLNNNFSFAPGNRLSAWKATPERIDGAMQVTAAHELHHVFQFLYVADSILWDLTTDAWWMEATSTWVEDFVYDGVDDYYWYLWDRTTFPGWFNFPNMTLPVSQTGGGWDLLRQYGDVIFTTYLSEHFANGTKPGYLAIGDIWNKINVDPYSTPLTAISYVANQAVAGWSVNDLYQGFAAANSTFDYEEGFDYKFGISVDTRAQLPVTNLTSLNANTTDNSILLPEYLGAAYIHAAAVHGTQTLAIDYTSPNTIPGNFADWGLSLVNKPKNQEYSLVLSALKDGQSVGLDCATTDDSLFAVATFYSSTSDTVALKTQHSSGPCVAGSLDANASAVTSTAIAGGLEIGWAQASDADGVAGYVISYYPQGAPAEIKHKTVYGPLTRTWIGGLAAAPYVVTVNAYDKRGNLGVSPPSVTATPLSPLPSVPPAVVFGQAYWAPPPPPSSGGGGGSGGGGCFIKTLGL